MNISAEKTQHFRNFIEYQNDDFDERTWEHLRAELSNVFLTAGQLQRQVQLENQQKQETSEKTETPENTEETENPQKD